MKNPTAQASSAFGSNDQRFSRLENGPRKYSTRIFKLGRSSVTRLVKASRINLNDTVMSQTTISYAVFCLKKKIIFSVLHSGTNSPYHSTPPTTPTTFALLCTPHHSFC